MSTIVSPISNSIYVSYLRSNDNKYGRYVQNYIFGLLRTLSLKTSQKFNRTFFELEKLLLYFVQWINKIGITISYTVTVVTKNQRNFEHPWILLL